MIPVRECDHRIICQITGISLDVFSNTALSMLTLAVVDVIATSVRVVGIVDNNGSSKAVAVLSREMAMIPEGACIERDVGFHLSA